MKDKNGIQDLVVKKNGKFYDFVKHKVTTVSLVKDDKKLDIDSILVDIESTLLNQYDTLDKAIIPLSKYAIGQSSSSIILFMLGFLYAEYVKKNNIKILVENKEPDSEESKQFDPVYRNIVEGFTESEILKKFVDAFPAYKKLLKEDNNEQ